MTRVSGVPPVHSFLRRATSRLHGRIDQKSILAELVTGEITLPRYQSAMRALGRAYLEIDRKLLQTNGLCTAGLRPYVARSPSIASDLVALGRSFREPECLPATPGLVAPASEGAYLGMRYVVEGAQLGGRVIYRHLHESFGSEVREIGSFWNPGLETQGSWPEVLKSLNQLQTRESLAAAARAARATFRHMERHLRVEKTEAM